MTSQEGWHTQDQIDEMWIRAHLPRTYRIGFRHSWMDYDALSGRYFIQPLDPDGRGQLYLDKDRSLKIRLENIDDGHRPDRPWQEEVVGLGEDGQVYTWGHKLRWRLIKKKDLHRRFLGRISNIDRIEDPQTGRLLWVEYCGWKYIGPWGSMKPEETEKSLFGPVLGVILRLRDDERLVGTAYYQPEYEDKLKCLVEMVRSDFGYKDFAAMYAVVMNHCHPFGMRTEDTSGHYIR